MNPNFRIVALPRERFSELFALDDDALGARGIQSHIVQERHAAPCRVSLADAAVGERVLLLPFTHHDVDTPYRGSGPIFVREAAVTAQPAPGEIPESIARRLLSVRAYDARGVLLTSDVLEGTTLAERARAFLEDPAVAYLHVHNARPGCYACRIERA